jgi:hypothetical protein
MVRKSASICVGCHSSVRPLKTGTLRVLRERLDRGLGAAAELDASYIRDSTRAVSAADSLCPICDEFGSR